MKRKFFIALLTFLMALLSGSDTAFAHCDGLDGPVVKAAQQALTTGNVNLVLIWVQKQDEGEIKSVFQKTLAVRKLSPQAKELADMYFFESLVRLHRASEGAPYTGLKPAGRDLGPAIPAADKAVESGSVKPLLKILTDALNDGVREGFKEVSGRKKFKQDDLEAGRAYVRAYTAFVEHVERIYETTKAEPAGHHAE
ncbi:MAG: hypothetical protein HYT78_14430 [Deltaproteobacteria bacterium]|nr:hypothetical protein [Deltaproteobacteria bacterium]